MSSHNTDSGNFVNSPLQISPNSPHPRKKRPNRYNKIKRYLGTCADLIFNKIAFLGEKDGTGLCIATQEFFAEETGYCVRTVQRALDKLEEAEFIKVTNYKPTKRKGENNEDETKWSVNHYQILKEGNSLWRAERSGKPPIVPTTQVRHINEWFRRSKSISYRRNRLDSYRGGTTSDERSTPALALENTHGNTGNTTSGNERITRNKRILWEILNERDIVLGETVLVGTGRDAQEHRVGVEKQSEPLAGMVQGTGKKLQEKNTETTASIVRHLCHTLSMKKEEKKANSFSPEQKQRLADI